MLEQRIVETIRRELPATVAIYLFGSHAAGRARSDSDVDVAVLLDGDLSSLRRWEVQERLAAEIHRDVDLVDLGRASTVMRAQVFATGSPIFDADPPRRRRTEGEALAAYARLNEDRREVLTRIAAEGRVHG